MLQFNGTAAPEGLVAISSEAQGMPEAHWRLDAKLALEGPVERPLAPRAARKTILKESKTIAIMAKRLLAILAVSVLVF